MQVHGSIEGSAIGDFAVQAEAIADSTVASSEGGQPSFRKGLAFGMAISLVLWAAILALILRL